MMFRGPSGVAAIGQQEIPAPPAQGTCPAGYSYSNGWCVPDPVGQPVPAPASGTLAACDYCWLASDQSTCEPGATISSLMGGLTDGITSWFKAPGQTFSAIFNPTMWLCDASWAIGAILLPVAVVAGAMAYKGRKRFL